MQTFVKVSLKERKENKEKKKRKKIALKTDKLSSLPS